MNSVALHPRSNDLGPFQVLGRCCGVFPQVGWSAKWLPDQVPEANAADVTVIHQSFATTEILDRFPDRSVIVMERIDSAQLWTRDAAEHPAVMAMPKVCALRDDFLNEPYHRYHECLIDRNAEHSRIKPISDTARAKVLPGPNYGQYERFSRFLGHVPDFKADRSIDVMFAGSTERYTPLVYRHRQTCCAAIDVLGDHLNVLSARSKKYPLPVYDDLTRKSKIVVSPWGNGELCYRDFDAMWCGAVLVKPGSDHVRTQPQMFVEGVTYFECSPDWSDLPQVVDLILERWDDLSYMRRRNYQMVFEAFQPRYVANWFSNLVSNN